MKKLFAALMIVSLSGCTLLDAYLLSNYDNVEYALVNKIRTLSELGVNDCSDKTKSHGNFEGMYWTAVELRNFSQYLPRNEDAHKLAKNLVELTKQGKDLYEKNINVSETFCKLKLGQINRTSELAQEVIGKKPRI